MNELLTAALEFAANRWAVFPVRPRGKTPLTARGCKDATTDETIIRGWWANWPDANVGVATSGDAVVVDIDGIIGENSIAALTAEYGDLPSTMQSRTGNGRHLWFSASGAGINSAGKLGEGVDVRGAGGFAVAPPSTHESGKKYEWISGDAPLAELPPWIATKLKARSPHTNGTSNNQEQKIPAGQRNATLTSVAGSMRQRGLSSSSILAALLQHNQEHCEPPLSESEVRTIAESVGRYPTPAPSASPGQRDDEGSPFQGDAANAERLADTYTGKLIYLADRQVRCAWDGRVWRIGDDGSWGRAAISIVRELYLDAGRTLDHADRERLAKRAMKSEGRTAQMMALAQVSTKLERLKFDDTFDRYPLLLNVANGILDMSSGKLGPHRPDALVTKITDITFNGTAKCEKFEKFLNHTFDDNKDLVEYVTRLMGYLLSGLTKEQAFWLFHGPGATSKSTFIKLLRLLAGEYATTLPAHALMIDRYKNQDYSLAELAGARVAAAVEIGLGRHLDSTMVKQVTGQDCIKACRKYENFFAFRSEAKLVIATNHRPVIRETSDAIWRRVKSVPFLVVIPEKDRIDNLEERLIEAEGPGILALAVRGFQKYLADGMQEPKAIRAAVEEYRRSEDVVAGFVDEHCVVDIKARVAYAALYAKFAEISKASGERPIPSDPFSKELERLGYHAAKSGSVRYRTGLRLRELGDQ